MHVPNGDRKRVEEVFKVSGGPPTYTFVYPKQFNALLNEVNLFNKTASEKGAATLFAGGPVELKSDAAATSGGGSAFDGRTMSRSVELNRPGWVDTCLMSAWRVITSSRST